MAPSPPLQFAEQFKEVKEAARLSREKSQERFELANPGLNIAAPEVKLSADAPRTRVCISKLLEIWGETILKRTKSKPFFLKQTEAVPEKPSQVSPISTSRRCPLRFSSKWASTQLQSAELAAER